MILARMLIWRRCATIIIDLNVRQISGFIQWGPYYPAVAPDHEGRVAMIRGEAFFATLLQCLPNLKRLEMLEPPFCATESTINRLRQASRRSGMSKSLKRIANFWTEHSWM